MTDIEQLVNRYVAVWNEPDPGVRDKEVAALWAPDAVQYLEERTVRGRAELTVRVAEAYEQFVRDGGFEFRCAGDAVGHHDLVRFSVYMVPAAGGPVAWTGFIVLRLDGSGQVLADHQFAEAPAPSVATGANPGTRAVVEEFLRRVGGPDIDRLVELYAPEVDWSVSWPVAEHPLVDWIRPRATRAEVADHFRVLRSVCPPEEGRVRVDRMLFDGDNGVLFGRSEQLVARTGRRFDMAFALHLTVSDGLITGYHVYEDSLAVVEAFGG